MGQSLESGDIAAARARLPHLCGRDPAALDDKELIRATVESIAENTQAAVEILREAMAKRTLPEWSERFATLAGPWAPVQDTLQAAQDAQIRANEYIVSAGELELVANPVQFDVSAPQTGPAPGFAEQTDEILLELGFDWDRIIELKTAGAVT